MASVRKRPRKRELFAASISPRDGVALLEVKRGAYRREISNAGDVLADSFRSDTRLRANIGDHLVVCGDGGVDDNAVVEVVRVLQSGHREALVTRIVAGALLPTTTSGHVLSAKRLRCRA